MEVLSDEASKTQWLLGRVQELVDEGDVIVFAGQRAKVDGLAETLKGAGVRVGAIHGDMDQVRVQGGRSDVQRVGGQGLPWLVGIGRSL